MNLVQRIQSNWHSLPGSVRGAIAFAAGSVGGALLNALDDPAHLDWHHLPQHMLTIGMFSLLSYALPNSRTPPRKPLP